MMDDPATLDDLLWAADREVKQHAPDYPAETRGCTDCQSDGSCVRLDGARLVVAQHEARRAVR